MPKDLKYCLSLMCPPTAEEALLDLLLESDDSDVFTSSHVHSHNATHAGLSAREQVMGRSQAVLVQVLMNEGALGSLIERIRKDFAGVGIRYWASAVALDGEIK